MPANSSRSTHAISTVVPISHCTHVSAPPSSIVAAICFSLHPGRALQLSPSPLTSATSALLSLTVRYQPEFCSPSCALCNYNANTAICTTNLPSIPPSVLVPLIPFCCPPCVSLPRNQTKMSSDNEFRAGSLVTRSKRQKEQQSVWGQVQVSRRGSGRAALVSQAGTPRGAGGAAKSVSCSQSSSRRQSSLALLFQKPLNFQRRHAACSTHTQEAHCRYTGMRSMSAMMTMSPTKGAHSPPTALPLPLTTPLPLPVILPVLLRGSRTAVRT